MGTTDLSSFLAARRAEVLPSDVGLLAQPRRRVPGLRREEVAMLAGMSVDYYARLEQGRERHPSPAVLNAIAEALVLTPDAREHMFRLAGLAPAAPIATPPVSPSLRTLLDAWTDTPALIINRQLDIVASNDLATALYSGYAQIDNLARMTFLDPAARTVMKDWQRAAEACVASLHLALPHADAAAAVKSLVAELSAADENFQALWRRNQVRGKTHEPKTFRTPGVGDIELEMHAFDVREAPHLQLIVYRAVSGTASADRLRILGSLRADAMSTRTEA